jgi:D-sedoheptulose 7-phosphate isomerase
MADQLPDATKGVANYIDSYLDVLKGLLDSLDSRLILCGNGGSGSTSSHLVCDFQKNIYLDGGKPFEVVALTDSPALLLAWGNDTSFENVFAGQARTWVRKNDVLIAISGSGNSKNVLEAVKVANDVGATTIGFCGYDGGKLAEMVTIPIVAERRNMQQVEDVHMILGHILFSALRDKITGYLPSAS